MKKWMFIWTYGILTASLISCSSEKSQKKTHSDFQFVRAYNMKDAIEKRETLTNLELENQGLDVFPDEIAQMKKLIALTLSGNQLDTIKTNLSRIQSLRFLELSNNNFRTFPHANLGLNSLGHLHLEQNNIRSIEADLSKMEKLDEVFFKGNPMVNFPKNLESSESVTRIDLIQTYVRDLPEDLLSMRQLKTLLIPSKLTEESRQIIDSFKAMDVNVQEFSFCEEIAHSKNISRSNRHDTTRPDREEVKYLSLSGQDLDSIPTDLQVYKNLEYLDLSQNNITEIGDALKDLKNLRYVDLSENKLSQGPSTEVTEKLLYLDLSWNNISTFNSERWSQLEHLFLEGNPLKSYISGQCDHLKVLDLSFTLLKDQLQMNLGSNTSLVIDPNLDYRNSTEPKMVIKR